MKHHDLQPYRPTIATIDREALAQNVTALKGILNHNCRLMAVVKADAYGHGMTETAQTALHAGAHWLGVALVEEALQLRADGIAAPILVLGAAPVQSVPAAVAADIALTVFDTALLQAMQQAAQRLQKKARAHLKIDTGMHRIGVQTATQLQALLLAWEGCRAVEMEGIFSHFANADDSDLAFAKEQWADFLRTVAVVQRRGHRPLRHICNTAGTLWLPEAHMDMVRCGIGLYGYSPAAERVPTVPLRPVMQLKTQITHLAWAQPGDTIGYGRAYQAASPRRWATLPIGYGDGWKRSYAPKGWVLIGGQQANIVGRICMDQCMVDVTDIQNVAVGHEAVLLGTQGAERITADDWASWAASISYECLLGVSARVPRKYT